MHRALSAALGLAALFAFPAAAAETDLSTAVLLGTLPDGERGMETVALTCDDTVLVHSVMLDIVANDPHDQYAIGPDSIRLGTHALEHGMAYASAGDSLSAVFPYGNLEMHGHDTLAVPRYNPLFIPVSTDAIPGDDADVVMTLTYTSAPGVACTLDKQLRGVQTVGALVPLTGEYENIGASVSAALDIAVHDFNAYLESMGQGWSLAVTMEDDMLRPDMSLEGAAKLHDAGVRALLGLVSSGSVHAILDYTEDSMMTVISCCSSSPSSAVPDHVFRLTPSAGNQALALSKIVEQDTVDYVIPVFRDDDYGHAVTGAILDSFEERGGVAGDPVPYPVDADGYDDTLRAAASAVDRAEGRSVGILLGSYREASDILEAAAGYESLQGIRWYATESVVAQKEKFSEAGMQAASAVDLTGTLALNLDRGAYGDLSVRLEEKMGTTPEIFAFPTYDSVWILGRAMLATQSTAQADLVAAIPYAGLYNHGVTGLGVLDENGDLAGSLYEVWRVVDGEWAHVGMYRGSGDTLTFD